MIFTLGDKVSADDRCGYAIPDGVIIEVLDDEKWPYTVRSESDGADWPYSSDELTAR